MNRRPKPSEEVQTPTSGSVAAVRVGAFSGALLSLAIVAGSSSGNQNVASIGLMLVMVGMFIAGYYATQMSGDFASTAAARTGAVAGLICGLMVAVALMVISLLRSVDPATSAAGTELLRESMLARPGSPGDAQQLYMGILLVTMVCCGALLPLAGLGLGAIGGSIAAQVNGPGK